MYTAKNEKQKIKINKKQTIFITQITETHSVDRLCALQQV